MQLLICLGLLWVLYNNQEKYLDLNMRHMLCPLYAYSNEPCFGCGRGRSSAYGRAQAPSKAARLGGLSSWLLSELSSVKTNQDSSDTRYSHF
jgi:hypothetical protein